MKLTICTSGRFHVADLARELISLGHDVTFHSIVPPGRLEAYGVPRSNQRCYLARVLPLVLAQRTFNLSPNLLRSVDHQLLKILDARFSLIANPGKAFIGMSGTCVKSLESAKGRGATIFLERGSRHIVSQQRILEKLEETGTVCISPWIIKRELAGYELADVITIPAVNVENSFLEQHVDRSKLFRNPYGVNLNDFQPTRLSGDPFDVIMVGQWCKRKGCDLLADIVLNRLGLRLLHVGPVGDVKLPEDSRFTHINSVKQEELIKYYSQARIFAMPSREDGFGLVYAQALACGLPIIGSTRSGAPDLAELTQLGRPIITAITPGNENELALAIDTALLWSGKHQTGIRDLLADSRESLSWRDYAARYADYLVRLCEN